MNRDVFMKELEYLLQDIPEEEKKDALDYYRDYLEEAGEHTEEAIREFGSPERIAAIIRSDIAGHLEEGGGFTERGYEDERFRDPNYQVVKRYDLPEQSVHSHHEEEREIPYGKAEQQRRGSSTTKVILWIVLLCVTSPIWLGLAGGLLGILVGAAGVLLAVLAAAAALTLVFFLAGVVAIVAGLLYISVNPLGALLTVGIGFLGLGAGFLFLIIALQFYGRLIPWALRGIVNAVSGLLHRKERRV